MSGVSLISHGWICRCGKTTIINRYILPLNFSLEQINKLRLALVTQNNLNLNLILSTFLNLQIKQNFLNFNIKDITKLNLNLKSCEE